MKTSRFALAAILVALPASLSFAQPPPDGAWRRLDPDIAWGEPAAFVDEATDRLVVLSDRLDAIGALDLAAPGRWELEPVAGAPPGGRDGQPLLHDAVRGRWIWVRLGGTNPTLPCEVWTLDARAQAKAWTLVAQGTAPGRRNFAHVAWDPHGNRLLAYGGLGGEISPPDPYFAAPERHLTDLWEFDFDGDGAWRRVAFAGEGPKVAPGGGAFIDEASRRLLLVGADASLPGGAGPSRIWALPLEGSAGWSVVATVQEHAAGDLYGEAWFHDAARGRVLVHGGRRAHGHGPSVVAELQSIDLATGASRYHFSAGEGPGARWSHAVARDAKRDRMIVQGGWPGTWERGASRETWALPLGEGGVWSRLGPGEGGPPWREGEASAYDPLGERVVVWGGGSEYPCLYFYCQTRVYGDVWSFDLSRAATRDWDFHPGPPGEGRIGASLVHDAGGGRLVAFGGVGQPSPPVTFFDDTAQFPLGDPGRWTLLGTGTAPEARYLHAAVVDARRRRMLVFGGTSGFGFGQPNTLRADAWSFDLAGEGGWTKQPLDPAFPSPGPALQAAIDPAGDRVLAVAWPFPLQSPQVWEMRLDAADRWTAVDVAPGDAPANPGRVVWDPVRRRLALFESVPQGFFTPATLRPWALELAPGAPARWRRLEAANPLAVPDVRSSPVVYDAVQDRFVVAHPGARTGVWALEYGTPRWPIRLSWARNGNGNPPREDRPGHRIVLHGASPSGSPVFPRPIDLARLDPATWTWTGVEPRLDGRGRPRIEVADVDGDGRADWIVDVRRGGGSVRGGGEAVTFSALDRDGVRLEGTLPVASTTGLGLHGDPDVTSDAAGDEVEVFRVLPDFARGRGPRLSFAGEAGTSVTATLYDVRGRRIAARTWTPASNAAESMGWDGTDRLAPGIYLARVRQGSREATVRLLTF